LTDHSAKYSYRDRSRTPVIEVQHRSSETSYDPFDPNAPEPEEVVRVRYDPNAPPPPPPPSGSPPNRGKNKYTNDERRRQYDDVTPKFKRNQPKVAAAYR
jgi:hypothetical protein